MEQKFNDIGSFLKYKRTLAGDSQNDYAVKLGITKQYYNEIECNRRKSGPRLIKKIADLTKTSPEDIYVLRENTKTR